MTYVFSIFDLFPYLILSVIVILLAFFELKGVKKVNSITVMAIVLFIFMAIRVGVGYDYYAYIRLIQQVPIDYDTVRVEPLVDLILRLSYFLNFPQLFFIITSFLIIFPIYKVSVENTNDPTICLISFFFLPFLFLESLSIVRNAIAFSFVLWAIVSYLNNRTNKFLLLLLIAICCHVSAIVGLLVPFLIRLKINRKYAVLLLLSSFLFGNVLYNVLSKIDFPYDIAKYIVDSNYKNSGSKMAIILNIICLVNIYYWDKLKKIFSLNTDVLKIILFGTCLWNILSFQETIRLRISLFFLIFWIVLIPSYILLWSKFGKQFIRFLLILFLFMFFCSSFIINIRAFVSNGNKISYLPYQTVFYNNKYK